MHRLLFRRCMTTIARLNRDGSTNSIQIRPSYANKPKAVENLMKGLPELLGYRTGSTSTSTNTTDEPSMSTWTLDDSGDTIHRHISLDTRDNVSHILQQIEIIAGELKHDPHTYVDETGKGMLLTISCTTHVPPGLSMKDVKLAKRIEEVLRGVVGGIDEGQLEKVASREQMRDGERRNMEAIVRAKGDCSCG